MVLSKVELFLGNTVARKLQECFNVVNDIKKASLCKIRDVLSLLLFHESAIIPSILLCHEYHVTDRW